MVQGGGLCRRLLVPVFLAVICAGCGFTGDASQFGEDVLLMNNMAEPAHLDPALQTSVEDQRITLGLFEGLTSYHPETLRPIPGVAGSWSVSGDRLEYVFHLRECFWSNGDPLSASDFLYAWRRVLTPPSPVEDRYAPQHRYHVVSRYASLLFCIAGAEEFYRGDSDNFSDVGITVVDSRTLLVRLERATPWFLELLCFATFAPVHPPTVEAHREKWTRPGNFVGNGPFVLKARRVGDSILVERNPRYWDRENVALKAIVYFSTDQIDTALDQFLAGETDWVRSFNPKKVRAWRNTPSLRTALQADPYLGTYFYRFNVRREPFKNPQVRQALSLACDRDAICRYILGFDEEPAEGLVPTCINSFVSWPGMKGKGLAFDPERARSLLADAGYPGGVGFPPVSIAFNTDVRHKAIAEAIQQMWRKHLGIHVELENREKRVHMAEERAGNYQVSRGSWIGDFNDPFTFLDFMVSTRQNNRTGWRNAEYDALVEGSLDEVEENRRLGMLARAEELLVREDPPILTIYHFKSGGVLRPGKFSGIHPNSRDIHPPKAIKVVHP